MFYETWYTLMDDEVAPSDGAKSVRNNFEIDLLVMIWPVALLCMTLSCCRGFCHITEQYLFLFSWKQTTTTDERWR